jgi:hypothetical protein
VLRESFGGANELRDHALADVFRARVCIAEKVVAGGASGKLRERDHLVRGGVQLVEIIEDLVREP